MHTISSDLLEDDKLFSIQYQKVEGRTSMAADHYHNHYEIYYQLAGERYYFIKDRSYYIKKGDIVVIDMLELHKTTFAGAVEYERMLINFRKEYLSDYINFMKDINPFEVFRKPINIYSFTLAEQNYIEQLLYRMQDEYEKRLEGHDTYLKVSLIELLILLNRSSEKIQHRHMEYPSALHKKISQIASYINNNYSSQLTLNMVAQNFKVSPYYFCRTFKEVTGFTFTEYLNTTRVKEAQKLLLQSNFKVIDIAEKVGFESSTHFGRIFKSRMGVSPLQYRKIYSG
jgi:AraC-like DNA-binding protein